MTFSNLSDNGPRWFASLSVRVVDYDVVVLGHLLLYEGAWNMRNSVSISALPGLPAEKDPPPPRSVCSVASASRY